MAVTHDMVDGSKPELDMSDLHAARLIFSTQFLK